MKKRNVILLVVGIIIVIGLITGSFFFFYQKEVKKHYEIEKITDYQYFVGKKDGKYGILNREGDFVIEASYQEIHIPNPTKDIFICTEEDKIVIINQKGEELFTQYDAVEALRLKNISSDLQYEKSVLKYLKDGKYGLINLEGKELTKPIYEEIDTLQYKEGELVVKQEGKIGLININGATLIKNLYDKIEADGFYKEQEGYSYSGYLVCHKTEDGYRYGYLNDEQKLILETEYNELKRVNEIENDKDIYLIGARNGKYGVLKNGQELIAHNYQSISYDKSNRIFVLEKNKKYGIVTVEGKSILPVEYDQIDMIGKYFYAKDADNKVTVFDQEGKQAEIDGNVSYLPVADDKYQIKMSNVENKTLYAIVKDNKTLTKNEYTYISYLFGNYFIACEKDGKLGVIDENEAIKIPFQYDSIQKIEGFEMIQVVSNETKITEFYSNALNLITKMENPTIVVKNDIVKISNLKDCNYISTSGQILSNQEVHKNDTVFAQKQGEKWGIVNQDNSVILDYQYDYISDFNQYGFAGILKDGKWGVANLLGNVILEPTYELRNESEPNFMGPYYQISYGFGEIYFTDGK